MSAQLRSELFKHRSTRTDLGSLASMLALTVIAVLLHGFGLAREHLDSGSEQVTTLLGRGEFLAVLFAALVGAMSITGEVRHGTIRPTFLACPWRGRVIAAKVATSMLVGAGFGLAASALAAGVGTAALRARGIDVELDSGDLALFVAGSAGAAALWGAIGVGVGAVVRSQVPAIVGLAAWLLFVESLLVGDVTGVGDVGRFAPGALGMAASGQDPETLLAPAIGLLLLAVYAVAAAAVGWVATDRRDVV
jgi:ABC-2 type transport system permease protein